MPYAQCISVTTGTRDRTAKDPRRHRWGRRGDRAAAPSEEAVRSASRDENTKRIRGRTIREDYGKNFASEDYAKKSSAVLRGRGKTANARRLRPIRKPRLWNSGALTQSDSQSNGAEFLGPQGNLPELQTQRFKSLRILGMRTGRSAARGGMVVNITAHGCFNHQTRRPAPAVGRRPSGRRAQ